MVFKTYYKAGENQDSVVLTSGINIQKIIIIKKENTQINETEYKSPGIDLYIYGQFLTKSPE